MSDPAEMSAPRDPGSYGRSPARGSAPWLVAAFGLVCLGAGYGIGKVAPRLLPSPPASAQPTSASAFGASPAQLAARPAAVEPAPPSAIMPASPEVARLAERVDALEGRQARAAEAAAATLAAAALMEAAQTSRPFADELAALEAASPGLADIGALRPYAEHGVASRSALAASFPDYAAHAAAAAHAPGEASGLLARIGQALSQVVTLRRVGEVSGDGPDAVLARAERQVGDGDLIAALATLDRLPPDARVALGPWRAQAEARAMVDRRISDLRGQALRSLTDLARSGG
jgi:hypothetical protein